MGKFSIAFIYWLIYWYVNFLVSSAEAEKAASENWHLGTVYKEVHMSKIKGENNLNLLQMHVFGDNDTDKMHGI